MSFLTDFWAEVTGRKDTVKAAEQSGSATPPATTLGGRTYDFFENLKQDARSRIAQQISNSPEGQAVIQEVKEIEIDKTIKEWTPIVAILGLVLAFRR